MKAHILIPKGWRKLRRNQKPRPGDRFLENVYGPRWITSLEWSVFDGSFNILSEDIFIRKIKCKSSPRSS